jgi:hypothetical protein
MAADAFMRVITEVRQRGYAAVTAGLAPEPRVAALLIARRVAQLHTATLLTAEDRMAAVSTANPQD